ncbi:cytochrome c biogenesis heme-transporting ATPase CcmA [Pokkaliibacter sp. CJK22405]|uniref:cytochrome c biogenesis heme-transporting ATPase CcmA n=1 Tax=Pokkaliibacter sp. CJK22405 TaxID=3384615 RepID=UPI003984BC2F
MPSLLDVKALACERDDESIFAGLDFELSAGELIHVLGANGAGKTSLLRILAGLMLPAAGEVHYQQRSIDQLGVDYRSQLLYQGHANGVKTALTPLENLEIACALQSHLVPEKMLEALTWVGLEHYVEQPCRQLSAGQNRRVSLARLFMTRAPLWILDEPFTAIDVSGTKLLEQRLASHCQSGGAVILTSHHTLKDAGSVRYLSLDASYA